jgi:hypothetical protein
MYTSRGVEYIHVLKLSAVLFRSRRFSRLCTLGSVIFGFSSSSAVTLIDE